MWTETEIKRYLKENLKEDRYLHVLGVESTAERLAKIYDEDVERAKLAALIHDAAKNKTVKEIEDIIKSEGIRIDKEMSKAPVLLHGLAGAIIGKTLMGIEDEDVFNAAAYHTTGRENMSKLEKIIYLSDYIEPNRDFPGVQDIRMIALKDLDEGVLYAMDHTIRYIIKKGQILLNGTVNARNYLIQNKINRS